LLPENREFIVAKTLEEGADLGVAFDGDADRCFFVDDSGEFVPGDFVTALLAESILRREPGAKVLYDVRASWAVPETIRRAGGVLKLQERKERFGPEGEVSHLDGLSVDAADWHMNVRPSNTEPLLRLNLEARSQELMERMRDEVLAVIRG